jgi:ADP-ribosylglycohydrolase
MTKEDPERFKDRVIGRILGVFIGDALGVGVHWQRIADTSRIISTHYQEPTTLVYPLLRES